MVAGLADLFGEFDAQEKQTESAARPVVAPTRLRDALHALNPHRFSIGRPTTMLNAGRNSQASGNYDLDLESNGVNQK